ncbi:D-alanine--poly(phosphoribitol) ligase [Streptomyces triticagri]|uniref:D-alanine--poly(Phosphoribitol) ligase n=1 Tax=Streptomyces triticagri TaxID=2293568 RepID=A0A372M7Z3_9ACTN|nr:AMP-binding protein [Streptomyces triticagri]RFU86635.1 D-alanine--poly(phosphoribitol) ligase [Streptomyces triticagri]
MRDIVSAIEETASRYPDLSALRIGRQELSYADLWDWSGRIAAAFGARPGRVGLSFAKSPETYAAYLGVLRAGGAVLPLSSRWPTSRVAHIVSEATPERILIDAAGSDPDAYRGVTIHQIADLAGGGAAARVEIKSADEAYLIYTSGSTGKPKGVPVRHGSLADYITHVVDLYELGPGARMAQVADLTFDASVFEIFAAWASGATVVVAAGLAWMAPVRFLREYSITHLDTVPSVISLAQGTRSLRPAALPELRWSMFSGEQLTYEAASAWKESALGSVIENNYGPTELAGVCARYRLPADSAQWTATSNATVPIGSVYPHLESLILGPDGTAAEEGELCVRGGQRLSSYVDPADNVGRFVSGLPPYALLGDAPGPDDWYRTGDRVRMEHGQLVHLGRVDRQVKLRGYRVELDEVESAVRSHRAVREAAVVMAGSQLVAVYTGSPLEASELKRHVAELVPDYMVPVSWEQRDTLPLNQNGKLDRASLEGR